MSATQAPTPGPLTAAIDMLSDARDFIDRFSDVIDGDYGTSEPNAAMVMVHEINATIDHLSAPTAPVEASGSEQLWPVGSWLSAALDDPKVCEAMKSDIRHWFDNGGYLRPQPSGETRSDFTPVVGLWKDQSLSRMERVKAHRFEFDSDVSTAVEAVDEEASRQALLSARPLALGGQQGEEEGCGDCPYCDAGAPNHCRHYTTPARAEAQDEGAAGEPVAWRDVVGFEGLYEVSSDGNVRSVKTGRIQAKNLMGHGYVKAELWRDGVRKQTSVHRVVAEAFLPRIDGLDEVNHIDGDKQNNSVANLEWSDRKSNTDHSRYILGNDVKAVLAIDPEDGSEEYFPSIEEAGRSGYKASGVYAALNGIKKTHGGKRWVLTEWRNPAHPSPSPAADEDRVRIAVEALEPFNEAYQAYLAVYANFMPQAATEAEQRFAEGERKDTAEEAAFDVLSKVSFEQLCAVNEALAALKSTAAKEGEKS